MPGPVLDITGVAELRGIVEEAQTWRIGATTTWSDLIKADLPPAFDALKLAAREVGATQIQNRGTLAGNLCNASPAADGVPPLLVLDAEVELASTRGVRVLPLAEFIAGPRQTRRAADELVTAVLIPKASTDGASHFVKLGARAYLVISIAMTAARVVIKDGVVAEAAFAIGSCGPVATRLPEVERAFIGAPLDARRIDDAAVAEALRPIADVRADAEFRATSGAELLRRTVAHLALAEAA